MNDRQIVDLYWQRSEAAIAETAEKYGRYCHAIAYNILDNGEDAEECVSDTWLSAWNAMPDKRPARLGAFLAKITRNHALCRLRSQKRQKRGGGSFDLALDELDSCLASPGDLCEALAEKELEDALRRFVRALPEDEQHAFVSRYFFLETEVKIAARMSCSKSKVSAMLKTARDKLRRQLIEEGLCETRNE